MNRKILFRILAAAATMLAPLAAVGQVNPGATPGAESAAPKYEVYVGAAYSRIRQVTNSYSGLLGGKATLSRDWGKYFALTGSVDYYTVGTGHSGIPNPGHPTMYSVLAGPEIHADLYENLSGLVFAELGAEHTGGEQMSPATSFAGGFGGGLAYRIGHNLSAQLTGDRVGASFSTENNTGGVAYSTHRTWNARVTLGVKYRF